MQAHAFDVLTADHDDVKHGLASAPVRRSRVVVSAAEYPAPTQAAEVAYLLAITMHGGMAVDVLLRD